MYELKNHTESVVKQVLKEYREKCSLTCSCERCLADIMALTLNQLPSRYYVTTRGKILTQWEADSLPDRTRVLSAITRAVKQVESSPSHPISKED
ncbi:MAG: late competence development ComFB family protein [Desulfitobacterium sp.]|nr:late competence development ComFB family protein [Desulfitobacterium sp.]